MCTRGTAGRGCGWIASEGGGAAVAAFFLPWNSACIFHRPFRPPGCSGSWSCDATLWVSEDPAGGGRWSCSPGSEGRGCSPSGGGVLRRGESLDAGAPDHACGGSGGLRTDSGGRSGGVTAGLVKACCGCEVRAAGGAASVFLCCCWPRLFISRREG